jgi:hypothetical protein
VSGDALTRRQRLLRCLRAGLVGGAVLGVIAGLLAAGVAFVWAGANAMAVSLAGSAALGTFTATLLGFTLPVVLGGNRPECRIPTGVVTRALAVTLAVGVHIGVVRFFIR